MARPKGIIAYGTEADRQRLAAIAHAEQRSGSAVLITFIQERYKALFGDLDPALASPQGE